MLIPTGELADRDFQCGDYNLSNAWITGLATLLRMISLNYMPGSSDAVTGG